MRNRICRGAWLLGLAAVGCEPGALDSAAFEQRAAVASVALRRVVDCSEAEQLVRDDALRKMNAKLDGLIASALSTPARSCTPVTYPSAPTNSGPTPSAAGASSGSAPAVATPPPTASAPAPSATPPIAADTSAMAKSVSMTNNQVAGVDEADFVKNDAKYLYAAVNGALRILSAWPAEESREISKTPLIGTAKKLFVEGDRALVYVSMPAERANNPAASASYAGKPECTYGYDCEFGGDGTDTTLLLYDVADRAHPALLRRLDLSGSLVAARRIGTAVHTVVVTPEVTFAGLNFSLPSSTTCGVKPSEETIRTAGEQQRQRNTKIILESQLPPLVPTVKEGDRDYAAGSCTGLYTAQDASGHALTSLMSLDMLQPGAPSVTTIMSKAGAVYASDRSLYMAVPIEAYRSAIHKFAIGAKAERSGYLASGVVKGHVLNQFSMDELAGNLRVATTFGRVPDRDVHSTLSVLGQDHAALRVLGAVDQIAPGEDIRAVRFDGERGFVVTFKKTDPLYMFDLSQPRAPRITGELKIPGFSTYMHMLDAQHLLAIGYDADDHDTFAYFNGVLLQIFDVSDPAAPALLHKTVIGTRGSSSEALADHLAFTFFQNKLAVPMTICEGGGDGIYGTSMTFSGLIVYDVSLENGIVERGRVAHPGANGAFDNAGCMTWWTRATSQVQRSVFMDDYVYSIALDSVRVQKLSAMGRDVAAIPLAP